MLKNKNWPSQKMKKVKSFFVKVNTRLKEEDLKYSKAQLAIETHKEKALLSNYHILTNKL